MSLFGTYKYNNQAIGKEQGAIQPWELGTNRDANRGAQYNLTPDYTSNDTSNGLFDSFNTDNFSMAGFNDFSQGAGGLYQMYQGHKMLGLYEDQVKDAQMNSAVNRNEIARRNTVRDNWSTAFQQA